MDPLSSKEKLVNQLLKSLQKARLRKIDFQSTASKSLLAKLDRSPINPKMYGSGFSLSDHTDVDEEDFEAIINIIESMIDLDLECDDMEILLNYPPSYFHLKIQEREPLTECEKVVSLYHNLVQQLVSVRALMHLSPEKAQEMILFGQDRDLCEFQGMHRGTQTFMTIFGLDQKMSIIQSMVRKHVKNNDLSYYVRLRYDPSSEIDNKINAWSTYCKQVNHMLLYIKKAYPRWSKYTLDERKKAKESIKLFLETFELFTKTEIDNLLPLNLKQMNKAKAIFLHNLDLPFITLDFAMDITKYSKFS